MAAQFIRLQNETASADPDRPISSSPNTSNRNPTILIAISVASAILGFALSVALARVLGPTGFQDFMVAVAALSLIGTFCELGTGKYALKALPGYTQSKQWRYASGYWRFSILVVLGLSIATTTVVSCIEFGHDGEYGDYLLGIAILFLPTTALVALVSELVMANRAAVAGALVTKIICPLLTLVFVSVLYKFNGSISAKTAIYCFGIAGIIGLLVAAAMFFRTTPAESLRTKPVYHYRSWARHCVWFFVIAFVMSWLFEISVIVLEVAQVEDLEIARYAAAAKTGSFILLAAKTTNKFYSAELSMLISSADWKTGLRLRRNRLRLVGSSCIAFVLALIFFGKPVLGLFGPEYRDVHLGLVLVSIGASVLTTYSMAPEFLKFVDRLKTVLAVQIAGGILLVVLTWWLGKTYGATGACWAFCIVMVAISVAFVWLTNRHLAQFIAAHSE